MEDFSVFSAFAIWLLSVAGGCGVCVSSTCCYVVLCCSEKTIAPLYKGRKVSYVFFKLVCAVLCVLVWVVLFLSFGVYA